MNRPWSFDKLGVAWSAAWPVDTKRSWPRKRERHDDHRRGRRRRRRGALDLHGRRHRLRALGDERLPADRVYALIGFLPDFDLFQRIGIELDPVTGRPRLDPETLETNVPGVHMAGSIVAGRDISEVFIENGRWDGEMIFGDAEARRRASVRHGETPRPVGE